MRKVLLLSGLLFLSMGVAFSQGSIAGQVKDSKTGETIIGANVVIQGTQIGASTNLEGNFLINSVAAGTYTLQVSFITYKTHLIPNVVVENGKRVTIDVQLSEDVSELDEVVISGTRSIDNDFTLLRSIKESKLVVTGISAEMISKTQDRDAADVVKRIPGVTIVGGRFVNIRGLNERYNVTMLHNAYAPSMEVDKRSFAFDIIPSGQIDQILVFKSPSPELPGDFAGGAVKVFTKGIPDENSVSFNYSTSYRAQASLQDFKRGNRGKNQWLGFNDGQLDIPEGFPSNLNDITSDQSLEQLSESFPVQWTPETVNAGLDQSFSITNNLKFNIKGIQVGNITTINYSNRKQHFDVKRKDFNEQANGMESPIYDYNDDTYNQNVRLGGLFNWTFKFNPNHTIEFKNLFNQINNSQYANRTGQNIEGNFYGDFGSFQEVFRGLYSGQLLGKHMFNNSKTQVDWVANYGSSYRDMPNYRRYRSDVDMTDGTKTLYLTQGAGNPFFMGSFFSEMNETSVSGAVNFTHTFEMGDNFLPQFAAGAFYEIKDRDFNARNIGYATGPSAPILDLIYLSIDELFTPEYIDPMTGIRLDEQTNSSDSYTAENKLLAYYGSVTLPVGKRFTAVAGARIEDNTQTMNSFNSTGDKLPEDIATQQVTKVLPSVNLSYNFTEKMLLRFAYGQTLNRPEFRERAPFGFYDFEFNWVYNGNAELRTAFIDNIDLRWEWYPSAGEMVTFGVFYKNFDSPIETSFVPGGGSQGAKNFTFVNAESAYSAGIEIDVRKSLSGIADSKFLDNLTVLFNAAIIKSEVDYGTNGLGQDEDNRPLMGQAPYIFNAGLDYNDLQSGLQVTALYNIVGPRIAAVGATVYPSIWEMPRNVLDLTVSKNFGENFQVKAGIADILNQPAYLLQDGNNDDKLEKENDQVIAKWKPGALYTIGFNYRIPYGNR